MRLLQKADVIIYAGSLVNPQLLDYAKEGCEIHNSAKMTLEEVISVMEQAEKNNLITIRLHTGEPSIYGAVREQMDILDQKGIAYESCPGVSACFGAAASLNLEYTRVEAPISGRVRRALVTEGAFANQNEFTHLTTIEQIDPIYVRFSQPASQYSSLRRAVVSGLWKGVPLGEIKVRLLLSNGEEYPHSGRIIFSDMAVDPNTDTIEMRALFPNPDQELLPGAYVRVVFDRAVRDNVFAIPRDAVIRTAQGASVFVVGPEGVLEARPVRADTLNGREWLVSEGLRDGDRVAVSHTMSLRPGMKVRSAAARPQPHAQQ